MNGLGSHGHSLGDKDLDTDSQPLHPDSGLCHEACDPGPGDSQPVTTDSLDGLGDTVNDHPTSGHVDQSCQLETENSSGKGGNEGEGEEEEVFSDDEITGFLALDANFNIEQRGHVSPMSLQLMEMISSLVGPAYGPASSSSSPLPNPVPLPDPIGLPGLPGVRPGDNPGSRRSRRMARHERLRKLNKKGGK